MKLYIQSPLFDLAAMFPSWRPLDTFSPSRVSHSTSSQLTSRTSRQSPTHTCLIKPREQSHYHRKISPANQRGDCFILGLGIKWNRARIRKRGRERQRSGLLGTSICHREIPSFSGKRGCELPCSLRPHCLRTSTTALILRTVVFTASDSSLILHGYKLIISPRPSKTFPVPSFNVYYSHHAGFSYHLSFLPAEYKLHTYWSLTNST